MRRACGIVGMAVCAVLLMNGCGAPLERPSGSVLEQSRGEADTANDQREIPGEQEIPEDQSDENEQGAPIREEVSASPPAFNTTEYLDSLDYLFLEDETARRIANFLHLSDLATVTGGRRAQYLAVDRSALDFILHTAVWATGSGPAPESDVEELARLIFGDDIQIEHQSFAGYRYDADRGVYESELEAGGYAAFIPVVLDCEPLEDGGYLATVVYLEESWSNSVPYTTHDWEALAAEDAPDYCRNDAPRYAVRPGEREDGSLVFLSHSQEFAGR